MTVDESINAENYDCPRTVDSACDNNREYYIIISELARGAHPVFEKLWANIAGGGGSTFLSLNIHH